MANKYQLITELYRTTLLSVTETPQAWKAFLRSACNNYKCPFDEQVLIYAASDVYKRQSNGCSGDGKMEHAFRQMGKQGCNGDSGF